MLPSVAQARTYHRIVQAASAIQDSKRVASTVADRHNNLCHPAFFFFIYRLQKRNKHAAWQNKPARSAA
jgi:hypothetical protein